MRAIMVCVDYSDLLALTLPYNRHHFDQVTVVTCKRDVVTVSVACRNRANVFVTESFYADGAAFNKWRALEEGLDAIGRHGWLCIMDADVLWPKTVKVHQAGALLCLDHLSGSLTVEPGQLCSPLRRMCVDPATMMEYCPNAIWNEASWATYPVHRNVNEWAGYTQIFHASDPVLGPAPWHQVDWKHAGGADSFFQQKWPRERKVRPPWECLHLGPAGENWMGRVTPLLDGEQLAGATMRRDMMRRMWAERRSRPGFANERL